jgi:membrane protease YdiL (CAAX protease family)
MTDLNRRADDGRSPHALSLAWVVADLALYWLWVYLPLPPGPQRLWFFDAPFLLAAAVALLRAGGLRAVRAGLVGRQIPAREPLPRAAVLLAVLVVAFYLVGFTSQGGLAHPTTESLLIVPVAEELVHRGFILSALLAGVSAPRWAVVLLSALVFTSTHGVAEWWRFVMLVEMGCILGLAIVLTRSVPFCVLCHALWNAMACCPFLVHPG